MDEYHTPSGLSNLEVLDWQKELQGMDRQIELPFPTMDIKNRRYKVFGMVTNMDWEGERLIHWLHERCGKSEEAASSDHPHAILLRRRPISLNTRSNKDVVFGAITPVFSHSSILVNKRPESFSR